jgi:hypothetical protein
MNSLLNDATFFNTAKNDDVRGKNSSYLFHHLGINNYYLFYFSFVSSFVSNEVTTEEVKY